MPQRLESWHESIQAMTLIVTKTTQRRHLTDPKRHEFESLAHAARQQQQLRFLGEAVTSGLVTVGAGQHFVEPAIEQEMRLGGIAQHVETGGERVFGNGGKVDRGGDVLQSGE